jgi:Ca2+-binding EF-hand superfamily protein
MRAKINMKRRGFLSIEDSMADLFTSFDTDGNGTVDPQELFEGLVHVLNMQISRYEVSLLFPIFDRDGDKHIQLAEFMDAVLHDDTTRATSTTKPRNQVAMSPRRVPSPLIHFPSGVPCRRLTLEFP